MWDHVCKLRHSDRKHYFGCSSRARVERKKKTTETKVRITRPSWLPPLATSHDSARRAFSVGFCGRGVVVDVQAEAHHEDPPLRQNLLTVMVRDLLEEYGQPSSLKTLFWRALETGRSRHWFWGEPVKASPRSSWAWECRAGINGYCLVPKDDSVPRFCLLESSWNRFFPTLKSNCRVSTCPSSK